MDTRQLEFFTAVAEEGNFTRAAERSFVSQPGLSSSIQALERELRVQLFERGRHGATLTDAGSAFLPRARHILRDVDSAQRALFSDDGAETPTVRIGAEQCFGDLVDLPDLLVAFGNSHPHAEITFSQDSTLELAGMLDDGTLDVAVMAFGTPADAPAHAVLLRTEPFVLLRKEGSGTIGWDELAAMRFVDFSESWAARQVLDEAFADAGKRRVSALVVSDVHMLLDLVQRGLGAAVVPASIAAKPEAQGLVATSVAHLGIDWGVYRVTKPDARPIAQAFAMMMVPQGTARELGDALVP